jgi:hypothetical protein
MMLNEFNKLEFFNNISIPHQTGTNVELQTFHDLISLVILIMENMKLK